MTRRRWPKTPTGEINALVLLALENTISGDCSQKTKKMENIKYVDLV